MWKAIKDLLIQVEAGTVKEIDDFSNVKMLSML